MVNGKSSTHPSRDELYQIRVEKSNAYSDNFAVLSLPTVEENFPTEQIC